MGIMPIRLRRALPTVLAALSAALLLQSCALGAAFSSPSGPTPGGTMTEAVIGSATSLNPLYADNDNSRDIDSLIYRGLVTVGPEERPLPDLAESWSVSPDLLTYTFTLRTDVRWADGRPFGADDVIFTFSILQNKAYREAEALIWQGVKVELAGQRDVRFTLKAADSAFLFNLRIGILPQHIFKDVAIAMMAADPASTTGAFGTGPFRVDSISKDRKVVTLKRNPYARPAPKLDQIVFRGYPRLGDAVEAVAKGDADLVGALQPPQLGQLAKRPELNVQQMRTYNVVSVLFNRSGDAAPYFGSELTRRALAMAIDRRPIVQHVLEGRADAAPGPIPPSDWAFSRAAAEKWVFDRQEAARVLDAEGWRAAPGSNLRSKEGRDFVVTVTTADAYPYSQVAEELSKQLKQVGVELRIDPVPASVLLGRLLQKQYQLALIGFELGPDPDQYSLWHSDPPKEALNFASPKLPRQALIDKDLEDARALSDRKARVRLYDDFQSLMADAAPAIFLFQPHYAYVFGHRAHGVRSNPVIEPADRFQYVSEWWVSKPG
jgi:peptide/nickel transport system substrate-binding protein